MAKNTGRELLEALSKLSNEHLSKVIYLEGCDCSAPWNASFRIDDDLIELTRGTR